MTQDELLRTLVLSGHPARTYKDEVQLQFCTECGNPKWNLELNLRLGVWHCWVCNSGGTITTFLREHVGVDEHIEVTWSSDGGNNAPPPVIKSASPISAIQSAEWYLRQRGLGPSEWRRFGLQVCTDKDHPMYPRILIPAESYWTREVLGFVGRDYIGDTPKYYNSFTRREIVGYRGRDSMVHTISEGPFDGMKLAMAGFSAAVLLGMPMDDIVAWAAQVPEPHKIVLCMDGDAQEKARKLWWKISTVHPRVYLLPMKEGFDPGSVSPAALRWAVDTTIATQRRPQ